MDASDKNLVPENEGSDHGSNYGGLLILFGILVVCVIVAYALSTLVSSPSPPVENIIHSSTDPQAPGQNLHSQPSSSPDPETQELNSLLAMTESISRYRLQNGKFPESSGDLLSWSALDLPTNAYAPSELIEHVSPGDFSAGGFTYLPYRSEAEGPVDSYILIGYGKNQTDGFFIQDPEILVTPGRLVQRSVLPLAGVVMAIRNTGEQLDLKSLVNSNQ